MKQIQTYIILLLAVVLLISGCADKDAQANETTTPSQIESIMIDGTGRDFSQPLELQEGLAIIKMRHVVDDSSAYFGIDLFEEVDNDENYIWKTKFINKIYDEAVNLNGSKAVKIIESGNYKLEIDADPQARWKITLEQPRLAANANEVYELTGRSMQATELFHLDEGKKTFRLKHDGSGKYVVVLLDDKGNQVAELVNNKGYFDENIEFDVIFEGNYLFNVEADGGWEVYIQ